MEARFACGSMVRFYLFHKNGESGRLFRQMPGLEPTA